MKVVKLLKLSSDKVRLNLWLDSIIFLFIHAAKAVLALRSVNEPGNLNLVVPLKVVHVPLWPISF